LSQPPLVEGGDTQSGTGDIVFSAFLSPKQSKLIWGVGPVLALPTTTNPFLGTGKWSLGPTLVVLKQQGPWTVGALANQLWSVGSASNVERQDVNQTYLQPFVGVRPEVGGHDHPQQRVGRELEAESGQQWTVPLILQVSKVTRLGPSPSAWRRLRLLRRDPGRRPELEAADELQRSAAAGRPKAPAR